jgi:hypothetical protein
MNLKDYIHYYIGCDVITTDDNEQAQLVGVTDNDAHLVHYGTGSYGTCDISGVKLKLRRLESMTEEEAIAIARLCFFDRDKGYPDSDFKARKVGIGSEKPSTYEVRIDNDWYDEVIKIGFITGNIWRCNGSTEHLHNQSKVFHYLLTRGFDLFGLIDAGLAGEG